MKEITIQLDEMVYIWLEHISEVTGKSVGELIADTIYNQVRGIEKAFTFSEEE